jgi:recombinational DNA repair protein (RecF pathway)
MRHKYPTQALVLARQPVAEASALVTLLTRDVGLVRARVQGIRHPGAKLASALQTFAQSSVILVAGKEGWRVSGAVLEHNWFQELPRAARLRAARIAVLLMRLVQVDAPDQALFDTFAALLAALRDYPEDRHDAIETLGALRVLGLLGLDAGEVPGDAAAPFDAASLELTAAERSAFIARVNRGIAASGL